MLTNEIVQINPALQELLSLARGWRIWFRLAWDDIRLRYRRSSIGPFWITISMAIRIYFMGFLYGHLFKIDISSYFPFLASGIITWTTAATLLSESSNVFIESESYLRNIQIPYLYLVMRVIIRNIIIFVHNIVAYIPILIYFYSELNDFNWLNVLYFLPNLIIIIIDSVLIGSILAIVGTRFRDMPLIVDSLIQVIFFISPIMWLPSLLPEKYQLFVLLNPFYHIINAVRAPLLGQSVELISYLVLAVITAVSFIGYFYLMNRCKYRIIFWL